MMRFEWEDWEAIPSSTPDLVHPNLGSTLLISRLVERHHIGVGGSLGQPVGLEIFNRTFEQLIILFQEVRTQLLQLREFKFPE